MSILEQHLATLPAVRIVYTDLDGTLLGRAGSLLHDAEGRPSISAAAALVAAARTGVAVVAVSGRRAASLAHDIRLMGLDGGIAEVGTVLIRDGGHHFRWGECPRDLGRTPREALDAAGALDVLQAAFGADLQPYEPWDTGREGGHLLHGFIDVEAVDRALDEAGIGWAKVVDNGGAADVGGRSGARAYHLLARGVGKAQALAEDLAERGLRAEQAMAIGDSLEDQTMAAEVGTYVQVANGHGDVGFRTSGSNGDGVAEAITAALDAGRGR